MDFMEMLKRLFSGGAPAQPNQNPAIAPRDATFRPQPQFQPNADAVEAAQRSAMPLDAMQQRYGGVPPMRAFDQQPTQDAISSDSRLQGDLAQANKNLAIPPAELLRRALLQRKQ